ncbi:hypothetical protein B9Z55_028540 [Caenorhabditis nigoni]|uniref:Uncharacterized protein n=1 Tax=Caenorhabditis nigoni TaxID=1611254 RepID=A0A2G5SB75_9PELO|nr:hypothetical protein B9Z55_028540 [Caenorhabditis nigoni]
MRKRVVNRKARDRSNYGDPDTQLIPVSSASFSSVASHIHLANGRCIILSSGRLSVNVISIISYLALSSIHISRIQQSCIERA